jgi:hypothetical protein
MVPGGAAPGDRFPAKRDGGASHFPRGDPMVGKETFPLGGTLRQEAVHHGVGPKVAVQQVSQRSRRRTATGTDEISARAAGTSTGTDQSVLAERGIRRGRTHQQPRSGTVTGTDASAVAEHDVDVDGRNQRSRGRTFDTDGPIRTRGAWHSTWTDASATAQRDSDRDGRISTRAAGHRHSTWMP